MAEPKKPTVKAPVPIAEQHGSHFSPCCGDVTLHPAVNGSNMRFCRRCGLYFRPDEAITKGEAELRAGRDIVNDPDYGEEVEIKLANGRALRTPAGKPGFALHDGAYVRIVDDAGAHVKIIYADSIGDYPEMMFAALLRTAEGQRYKRWT